MRSYRSRCAQPSQGESQGRYHGKIDRMDQEPRTPEATEPSTSTIVVLNRDLFFGVRIGNLLRSAGYSPVFAKTTPEFVDSLANSDNRVVLGIIDLGALPDWPEIRAHWHSTPLLAFGPHKDADALRAAKSAGVTRVVSNSEFHKNALTLVERYALKTT
jgi:hypothetical protein